MTKEPKTVMVDWEDASLDTANTPSTGSELVKRFADSPFINRSVGWLVHKDADRVVIASERNSQHEEYHGETTFRNILNIPTGMVRKVTVLNGVKPDRRGK